MKLIDKSALVAEIEKRKNMFYNMSKGCENASPAKAGFYAQAQTLEGILSFINTLEVKEVDVSNISENLAEAHEYLGYTSTGNLAHNKPMVSARLKKAIRSLFDAGLFELTHDKKYRMENLGLKAQKGEEYDRQSTENT